MDSVKDIYIPYLNAGYSDNTVQDLLCDMKIYHVEDHEKIHHKALEILTEQNEGIQTRNSNRHWVVKVLDTLLWALSLGFLRLLENEIKIDKLMSTANKIQEYVQNTPLINQMDRADYDEACEKIRLEEEAKQQEIEQLQKEEEAKQQEIQQLQQELQEKEKAQQTVLAKLQEELKLQNAAMKEAGEKGDHASAAKQAELKAKAEKAQQEFNAKQAELQGEAFQKQEEMKQIRKEIKAKSKTTEQKKFKELKDQWLDEVPQEHQRLQAKGVITPASIPGDHMVHGAHAQQQFEVIIGRVREIKEQYKATHYVFTHGQGRGLSVINECMQRLMENFTPALYNPLSMPFRLPHSVDLTENVTEFFKKYPNATNGDFNDDELNKTTGELLSVDTYMLNTAGHESALFFFATGTNINMGQNPKIGESIFKNIFINYLKDNYLCDMVAKKAAAIAADHMKATQMGTLWAICIPKTVVEDPAKNMAYRSHAFGKKCNCHSTSKDIEILEKTQRDEAVPCTGGLHPQYRLLTARLVQEPGVRSFPVNGLKKAENKDFKRRIKNLVRETAFYSAIVGLRSKPLAEESTRLHEELKALCDSKQIDPDCLEYLLLTQRDNLSEELLDTIQIAILSLTPEENFAFA